MGSFSPKRKVNVLQPLIPRLHDFTLICLAASLACKNRFSAAALLSLVLLAQACASQPIRAGWVMRAGLKETGAEPVYFKQRENTPLQHWPVWANWCLLSKTCRKPVQRCNVFAGITGIRYFLGSHWKKKKKKNLVWFLRIVSVTHASTNLALKCDSLYRFHTCLFFMALMSMPGKLKGPLLILFWKVNKNVK